MRLVLESDTASLDGAPLRFAFTPAPFEHAQIDPSTPFGRLRSRNEVLTLLCDARKPPGLKPCHLSPLATYPLRLHSLECGTPLPVVEAYHATKFVFAPCPLQPKVWKLTEAALRATSVATVSFGLRSMLPPLTRSTATWMCSPIRLPHLMAAVAHRPCRKILHGRFTSVDELGLSLEFPLLPFCTGNAAD